MRRLLPLLCSLALLIAADCGDAKAATPPPIKGVSAVALTLAGDTVNASWSYKSPGLFATDTAVLTWSSKAIGATGWTAAGTAKSRGTTASKVIPQVATGDSVRLCIVVTRVGAVPSPTKCGYKLRAPAPSGGVDTIQLSVRSIIVRPDSAKVFAAVAGKPFTDSNRVQFCAAARLSDDAVILTTTSKAVAGCDLLFADVVGFVRSRAGRVTDAQLGILIEGTDFMREQFPDGHLGPAFQVVKPRVRGAFHVNGEWWLVNPLPVPTAS